MQTICLSYLLNYLTPVFVVCLQPFLSLQKYNC
jgi:hypothetical protein